VLEPEQREEASAELEDKRLALVREAAEWFSDLSPLRQGTLMCALQDSRTVSLVWVQNASDQDIRQAVRAIAERVRHTDDASFRQLATAARDASFAPDTFGVTNNKVPSIIHKIWDVVVEALSRPGG